MTKTDYSRPARTSKPQSGRPCRTDQRTSSRSPALRYPTVDLEPKSGPLRTRRPFSLVEHSKLLAETATTRSRSASVRHSLEEPAWPTTAFAPTEPLPTILGGFRVQCNLGCLYSLGWAAVRRTPLHLDWRWVSPGCLSRWLLRFPPTSRILTTPGPLAGTWTGHPRCRRWKRPCTNSSVKST